MALIKLGGGVTDIRGSIGGTTFSRSKAGNYARGRVKPVNPCSNVQETRRTAISHLSRYWALTLDAAERTGWNQYAAGTTWTNKLGEVITINGLAAFIRANTLRLLLTAPILEARPTEYGHAGSVTSVISASAATQKVTLQTPVGGWSDDLANDWLIGFQGLPASGGRQGVPKRWSYFMALHGGGPPNVFPKAIDTDYPIVAGQQCVVRLIHLDPTGRVSTSTFQQCVAGP